MSNGSGMPYNSCVINDSDRTACTVLNQSCCAESEKSKDERKYPYIDQEVSFKICDCPSKICKCLTCTNKTTKDYSTETVRYNRVKGDKGSKREETMILADFSDDEILGSEEDFKPPQRIVHDGKVNGKMGDNKMFKNKARRFQGESFIMSRYNVQRNISYKIADERDITEKVIDKNVSFTNEKGTPKLHSEKYSFGEVSGRKGQRKNEVIQSCESVFSEISKTKKEQIESKLSVNIARNVLPPEKAEKEDFISESTGRLPEGEVLHCNNIDDLDPSEIKVTEVNQFETPSCSEIKMFEHYIISVVGEFLTKIDRHTLSEMKKIKMPDIRRICKILSHSVVFIRINKCISVVECETLETKYTINIRKAYAASCHIKSFVNAPKNLPDQHYVFAVAYTDTNRSAKDEIDIIRAKPATIPNRTLKYKDEVSTLYLRRQNYRGISALASLSSGAIVVGFSHDVECIHFDLDYTNARTTWTISLKNAVTDICCSKKFVFICIKDDHRLALLCPENGDEISSNILPFDTRMKPDMFSMHGDSILVKEFSYDKWRNVSVDCKVFRLLRP